MTKIEQKIFDRAEARAAAQISRDYAAAGRAEERELRKKEKASKKKEVAPAPGSIMLQDDRVFIWKNDRWFDAGYVLYTDLSITYSKGWEKGSEMPSGELTLAFKYDTHEFDHILNFSEKANGFAEVRRMQEQDEFDKALRRAQLNVQRAKEGKA